MKRLLYSIGAVAGIVAGALIIWKLVIPFIGSVFSWFAGWFTGLL